MHLNLSSLTWIVSTLYKKGRLNTPWDNISAAFMIMFAWPLTVRVISNKRNTKHLEISIQIVCNWTNNFKSVLEWFGIPILKIGLNFYLLHILNAHKPSISIMSIVTKILDTILIFGTKSN